MWLVSRNDKQFCLLIKLLSNLENFLFASNHTNTSKGIVNKCYSFWFFYGVIDITCKGKNKLLYLLSWFSRKSLAWRSLVCDYFIILPPFHNYNSIIVGFYRVIHALSGYEFEFCCSHLKNSFNLKLGQTSDACTRWLV